MPTKTIAILLSGAVTALLTHDVGAQSHPEKPTYKYEKCYGVAKAGMNDCFFSGNSCAGTSVRDNEPGAWIYVPSGTCRKITGGTLEPPTRDR